MVVQVAVVLTLVGLGVQHSRLRRATLGEAAVPQTSLVLVVAVAALVRSALTLPLVLVQTQVMEARVYRLP